ncbi:hypothetical protein [Flavobacterium sp. ACN6]|uniref:hypothetical protein n=1 Tax=Flavobacterium sp. ACN6 TaxID=1920426 RepID=UPI000BB33540|nr:hypothetical protein [Flavobacterium sp. ACN6]PBJ09263.1 hypothetical protein BSF42_33230 [Flavobacterium sp. ACN6]
MILFIKKNKIRLQFADKVFITMISVLLVQKDILPIIYKKSFMASSSSINNLNNVSHKIRNYNLEKVVRKNLGSEAFNYAEEVVNTISKIVDRITPYIIEIDEISIQDLIQIITEINSNFDQISRFDNGKFLAQRPTYLSTLSNLRERAVGLLSKIIGLIHELEKSTITIDFEDQLGKIKDETLSDAEEIKLLRNRLTHEIEDFETRYTTTFQKAEINEQVVIFSSQAETFLKNSKLWIAGICGCASILIIVVICLFKNFCFELSCFNKITEINYNILCEDCNRTILYLEIFKAIFFRLFIISFLIYLLNFCVKNYNASMHNYTINKHKGNSLDASIRLLERLYSENAKDEVLTNAANAIFSHQPTGYTNKDPENIQKSVLERIIEKVDPTKNIDS